MQACWVVWKFEFSFAETVPNCLPTLGAVRQTVVVLAGSGGVPARLIRTLPVTGDAENPPQLLGGHASFPALGGHWCVFLEETFVQLFSPCARRALYTWTQSFLRLRTPHVSSRPGTCPLTFSPVSSAGQSSLAEIMLWALSLRTLASFLFPLKTRMIPAVPHAATTQVELTVV